MMEGITMPFNWPKCGPALSPSRQTRPLNMEVSPLRRARVMLSQSLACLERDKVVVPPKLDGQRTELSLALRKQELEVGVAESQNCDVAWLDASCRVAQEHKERTLGTCGTPSCSSALLEENPPGEEIGNDQLVDLPLPSGMAVLESPSGVEDTSFAEFEVAGTNLPLENSFVLVNPERHEAATIESSIPHTNCLSGLRARSETQGGVKGLKLLPKNLKKASILSRPAATVRWSLSKNLDSVNEMEEGSEEEVKEESSSSLEEFGHIVTTSALGTHEIAQRPEDQVKLQGVAETGIRVEREGKENRRTTCILSGDAVGPISGDTKSSVEGRARRRDLRFQELTHGRFLEGRLVYRQTFVVRSYEVGLDKTASVDTLTNLFQEVALNHVWLLGISGDGFGATHAMNRHRLICVVTRMHVEVDRYPAWNELVDIDSWLAPEGKHGLRRDWLVHDHKSGQVLARATSTWVMMNKDTRRISKVPRDVKAEITPFFVDRAVISEIPKRLNKLGETAQFVQSGLRVSRRDMDANQHVNNVKYIDWIMESVPPPVLATHELSSITMEYRRECSQNSIVESLTDSDICHPSSEYTLMINVQGNGQVNISPVGQNKKFAYSSGPLTLHGAKASPVNVSLVPLQYSHMLRTMGKSDELLRGRTTWRLRRRELCETPKGSINI